MAEQLSRAVPLQSAVSALHVAWANIAVHVSRKELLWIRHRFYTDIVSRESEATKSRVNESKNAHFVPLFCKATSCSSRRLLTEVVYDSKRKVDSWTVSAKAVNGFEVARKLCDIAAVADFETSGDKCAEPVSFYG